ncbi:MAG: hypothetical protein RIS70_823 [Planctomycetota bacterium]
MRNLHLTVYGVSIMSGDIQNRSQRPSVEDRLVELESQLAHHQRVCEQLNEVVVQHTKTIMELEYKLARLESQWKDLRGQTAEVRDLLEEKPPHY